MSGIAFVTTHDYHVVMKKVGVAELKAKLSEHLRAVRAGESITVMDRERPVADLVPHQATRPRLRIRPPKGRYKSWRDIPKLPPLILPPELDPVAWLIADRKRR